MGDVVARATDPGLGRIKLAWWREQLDALDTNRPPAEPRLQAVADHLLPLGIKGSQLADLEAGWATLLDEQIDPRLVAGRGETLFRLGARLLGANESNITDAGAAYALASVARRGVPELSEPARQYLENVRSHRFDRKVRPLTMLARAAFFEGPERAMVFAMLAHRWSGRIG